MELGCFHVMNERLSFNICHLETSYQSNRDIPKLDARITKFVPESLSYAACNWKDHLPNADLPGDLQQELSKFLQDKLLFWFELLSLLKSVNRAGPFLEAALNCYNVSLISHLFEFSSETPPSEIWKRLIKGPPTRRNLLHPPICRCHSTGRPSRLHLRSPVLSDVLQGPVAISHILPLPSACPRHS